MEEDYKIVECCVNCNECDTRTDEDYGLKTKSGLKCDIFPWRDIVPDGLCDDYNN